MRQIVLLILVFLCNIASGQSVVVIKNNPTIGGNVSVGGINFDGMNTLVNNKETANPYDGSPYLFEWEEGSVCTFAQDTIKELTFRYNLIHNNLEIKYKGIVKVMPREQIASIITPNQTYVNSKSYRINQKPIALDGFLDVIYEDSGSFNFVSKTIIEIVKPHYYVHLDMGNKNSQLVQKKKYYLITPDNQLHEVAKSKKDNLAIFGKNANAVASYMKKEKLKFKLEQDIIKVLQFLKSYSIKE